MTLTLSSPLVPAQAGTHELSIGPFWIPAFAGMIGVTP